MNAEALDLLLERLTQGEADAAEEIFQTFEPVLRTMVRRWLTPKLRVKFDSMDVVQSVWADVLDDFREAGYRFTHRDHLRAYLTRVTYNHFVNNCRQNRRAIEHERPFSDGELRGLPPSDQPRPSEVVQADELWMMLRDLCRPAHRDLLQLKRQGFPIAEIAARTGLHEGSVRRILYNLARRLAVVRGEPHPLPGSAG